MLQKFYASFAVVLVVFLASCASFLSNEPIKVDPVEQKYIETEVQLKNLYLTMAELARAEKRARAAGAFPDSIVSKADYNATLDRLDTFKLVLREGRKLIPGECLDVTRFNDLTLAGCLSREQIALLLLEVLSKFNAGRLP